MKITSDRHPHLVVEGRDPIPLLSAEVRREVECSYLCALVDREGGTVELPAGARVALYEDTAEVFVGVVQPDGTVLDLLSCEAKAGAGEEYVDL